MRRCSSPRFIAAIGAVLLVSLFAVSGFAQTQSGNIYGKVQAKDGSALPGVSVTLTGVGAPATALTDGTGSFRFLNLSPGSYALKAELSGFGVSTRQGIGVGIGRNADVTMTLNPAAAESITVTAEAPLLDVRKSGTGAAVQKVELEKVPTGRDPWVILQQTPGVVMDRINVGGNESGQQSQYVSKGTGPDQSTWNVDGVNITDVGALGSSPTYYDFDSFEEMQITTGGTDPRIMTPGVQLNMVTKRGTNDFKGSARWFHTANSLQSDPKIPAEAKAYLLHVNEINKIDDEGGEIGGPIIKDKLWLWGAYSDQKIDLLTATVLSSGSRFLDKTHLKTKNLKANAQPTTSNSLSFAGMRGDKIKLGRNIGPSRFPETAWNQGGEYKGPTMWKIEDTQIFGPNLYLTGLYSKVQGGFKLIADNGKGCQSLECGVASQPAYLGTDGAWHRSYLNYLTARPQKQQRLDGSTFVNTGSVAHELKFGFGYRDATVNSQSVWPGSQYTVFGSGVQLFRDVNFTYGVKQTDAYVGDTVMLGNLTVQGALRYDVQKGTVAGGSVAANPTIPDILPAISWNGISGLKWDDISPRLGLTYTLGADRKTLLRGAYSRYVDQLGGGNVSLPSPGGYQYLYYYFNDLNHDNIAQRPEIDFDYGLVAFAGVDPKKLNQAVSLYRWDKNFHAPKADEFILGAEHEVMPDLVVGFNATYRKLTDFTETIGEKTAGKGDLYQTSDYVLHAPATATMPDGTTKSLPYYSLKPGLYSGYFVIRNRPDYNQVYKGYEFNITKRMSNRWMMRGNLTLQDWTQHVGAGAISDPTVQRSAASGCNVCDGSQVLVQSQGSGDKSSVYLSAKWAYSVTGVYQIPVIETAIGFNLNGRQGYPTPYAYRVVSDSGFKFLLASATTDSNRLSNVRELDLRLSKDIRISRASVILSADLFNVLNENTVLQRDVRRLNLSSRGRVREVQSPRVIRIGARFTF